MADDSTSNPEVAPDRPEENPAQERADLALEIKGSPKRKDTPLEAILHLDSQKPLTEQPKAAEMLETALINLAVKALQEKEKKEDLAKSPGLIKKYAEDDVQVKAEEKWEEIFLAQPQVASDLWKEVVEKATSQYGDASEEKSKLEAKNGKEASESKTQWMSTSVKIGLIAAGAVGAYELWKYFTEKEEDKKSSQLLLGSALTAMGVGAIIGSEQIGKWSAEYLNLYVSDKALGDFWDNLKKGEILKAFQSLNFDTECPGISDVAEKLDISKKTVVELKDIPWGTFNSFHSKAERTTKSYLHEGLKALGLDFMPGVSLDDETGTAAEEKKLQEFIADNKAKISGNVDKMTIGEILTEFKKQNVFDGKGSPSDETSEKPDKPDEEGEKVKSNFPHVAAALEGIKDGKTEWDEGVKEIAAGVLEDGGAIAMSGSESFLVKGALIIPLSSLEIVSGQFQDLAAAISGEGPWKNVLFEENQVWWLGTYAVAHGAMAFMKGKPPVEVLQEAAIGGGKGIIDSYLIIPKTAVKAYKAAKVMGSKASYLKYRQEEIMSMSPAEQIHGLHEEAAYYAERYEHYLTESEASKSSNSLTWAKGKVYEAIFGKGWSERMATSYGKKYFETYKKFLEKMKGADPELKDISLEGIEKESTVRAKLLDSAKKFTVKNPAESLPEVPRYLTRNPKFATPQEATKAGLKDLEHDFVLYERMQKLGLDHERVEMRLRETGITSQVDLEKLVTDLESSKNPALAAKTFEMKLFAIKNPKVFGAYQGLKKTAGIAALVYMVYDFENSKDKWNTLGSDVLSLGAFEAGFAGGQYLPIPNPIIKEVAAIGVGTVSACGGAYAWETFAKPKLEKYFPNRNEVFNNKIAEGTGDYFEIALGGAALGSIGYAADAMGMGDGLDETADPIEYLQETSYTWHPDYVSDLKIFGGDHYIPYDNHRNHDIGDLRSNAQETKATLETEKKSHIEEIKEIDKKLAASDLSPSLEEDLKIHKEEVEKRISEIDMAVLRFETYIDDSWLDIKKMELVFIQANMLEPVYERFGALVQAKFGDEALTPYSRLMARLQKGEMSVKGEDEMKIWQYLCDEKAPVDGGEVSFVDFTSMTILNYENMKFVEQMEKEKTQFQKPVEPTVGETTAVASRDDRPIREKPMI